MAAPSSFEPAKSGKQNLLLFGGTGAMGKEIRQKFTTQSWNVVVTARHAAEGVLALDPFAPGFDASVLDEHGPFTAACWAQGANTSDSIYDVDADKHLEIYRANCLFIVVTLQKLLERKLLTPASRLCVISSIWQNIARQNKFSYTMTKAALQGLVLSAAADLAEHGHLINAVLPGALDTPMTRQNLKPDEIARLEAATKFKRLPALQDVAELAFYLCSPQNTGITGQFIAADLGFSHVRLV